MVEVIRLVADALADPTTGVNAQIAAMDLRAGDTRPAPIAAIVDETRTGWVSREKLPRELLSTGPILSVLQVGDAVMDGERVAVFREILVEVGIRLAAPADLSEDGTTQLLDTFRAVHRALREMLRDANADSLRRSNEVEILTTEAWRQSPLVAVLDDAVVTGTLIVTFTVRDNAPGV